VRWWPAWLLAGLLLLGSPAAARAQLFLASRARPEFMVGPLLVRASVSPERADVPVEVLFSVAVPPTRSAVEFEQDLYLLWPGAVAGDTAGRGDPALARYVEGLGFVPLEEGRLQLLAQNLYGMGGEAPPEPLPGGAPYVTFVREGGPLGLTSPATWVRIPWTPRLVNRTWLVTLRFTARDLVRPKPATWVERTFWGPRYRVALSFHDVRPRAVFPLYFNNRDRVVRLSDDPSQLIVNFAEAGRLKIDEVFPQSSSRRRSESLEDTEVLSLFLDRSEGLTPQVLTAQFGYFSGVQSWAPVLIPALFFLLGNLAGPLIRALAARAARALRARLQFGRGHAGRESGVVLGREQLSRIVPGETTHEEVLRVCGPLAEEHERLASPDSRTLVYRGRRAVPHRRRTFWWLATVDRWDVEDHEVEIALEGGRVRDVQARVRRTQTAHPGTP
jgi:hypothetical protein